MSEAAALAAACAAAYQFLAFVKRPAHGAAVSTVAAIAWQCVVETSVFSERAASSVDILRRSIGSRINLQRNRRKACARHIIPWQSTLTRHHRCP